MTPVALLPKVRSRALLDACAQMPCTLRIGTFIGLPCSGQNTVVGAHIGSMGKGMSTKVSDLSVVAACMTCHDLYDRRSPGGTVIRDRYPAAFGERVLGALQETQARWVEMGLLTAKDQETV